MWNLGLMGIVSGQDGEVVLDMDRGDGCKTVSMNCASKNSENDQSSAVFILPIKGKNLKQRKTAAMTKLHFREEKNTPEDTRINLDFSQYAFFCGFKLINNYIIIIQLNLKYETLRKQKLVESNNTPNSVDLWHKYTHKNWENKNISNYYIVGGSFAIVIEAVFYVFNCKIKHVSSFVGVARN